MYLNALTLAMAFVVASIQSLCSYFGAGLPQPGLGFTRFLRSIYPFSCSGVADLLVES